MKSILKYLVNIYHGFAMNNRSNDHSLIELFAEDGEMLTSVLNTIFSIEIEVKSHLKLVKKN